MSKKLLRILLIVSALALYLLLIKPVYTGVGGVWEPEQSLTSLMSLDKQYDSTMTQAEGLADQAASLKKQYDSIQQEDKDIMQVMVPNSIDKVRLLSEVNNMILKSGISPSELSYSEGEAVGGRGTAIISLAVKTNYQKFKEIMDNFEKSKRLYSIQSVSFSSPEQDTDLIMYQARLETYYIK